MSGPFGGRAPPGRTRSVNYVRAIRALRPLLSPEDIHVATGVSLSEVKGALERRPVHDKPKSRLR